MISYVALRMKNGKFVAFLKGEFMATFPNLSWKNYF